MKRLILCLLALSLLTSLLQPVFASDATEETDLTVEITETAEQPVEATEITEQPAETEATEPSDETAQTEPTEETATELEPDAMPAEPAEPMENTTLTTSAEGIAFITEMMGSYNAASLASAESTVNTFASNARLTLSQHQFDALVDLVMAYGSYILTSGYKVETIIASGVYTDADLASAFCSWVKNGQNFSQERLNRRIRELKLFLYASYDGNCDAKFRYVIFNGNGGTPDDNTVLCYMVDQPYTNLPTATRSGKYFAGWYDAATGGKHITNSTVVSVNYTLYAHWSGTEVEDPNEEGSFGDSDAPPLKVSEPLIQFIKDNEGFCKYPIYDYGQYSIGYGTRVPDGMLSYYQTYGITEEEADYLLRMMLVDMEEMVDKVLAKGTVTHTQNQYDAIVSFTYNLGSQWMNANYQIYQYFLHGGYTELEFVNAIGSWCSAGGSVLSGLVRRRIDEADMYLNGNYTKGSTTYLGVKLEAMGGTTAKKCVYFISGQPLGNLPKATRSGYELVGWFSKSAGGTQFTSSTIAPMYGYYTFYAQWKVAENDGGSDDDGGADDNGGDNSGDNGGSNNGGDNNGGGTGDSGNTNTGGVFTDVSEKAWYYNYVYQAVELGLFSGITDTTFAPNATMTRAMMVTVLYRMAGSYEGSGEIPFTDVSPGAWYANAVAWGYENRVVSGLSETRFGVNHNVTREQLVTMLFRFANYAGMDTTTRADLSVFPDAGSVSAYAKEAMEWAVGSGIISGSDGMLLPKGSATRAQCATMLVTYIGVAVPAAPEAGGTEEGSTEEETTEPPVEEPTEPITEDPGEE